MAQSEARPASQSRRFIVFWLLSLLFLGLCLVIGLVGYPVWQVRQSVSRCKGYVLPDVAEYAAISEVPALGGESSATEKIEMYLRMPELVAPHKEHAVSILPACGKPGLGALLSLYDSDKPRIKAAVLYSLTHHDDKKAIRPLVDALSYTGREFRYLRQLAARRLGGIGDPAAVKPLSTLLAGDHVSVRLEATAALGKIGTRSTVAPLLRALRDKDERVRQQAEKLLKKFLGPELAVFVDGLMRPDQPRCMISKPKVKPSDPRAEEFFIEVLKTTQSVSLLFEAALALEMIGGRRSVPILLEKLKHKSADIRGESALALGAIGDARAKKPLEDLLAGEKAEEVRQAAREALEKIKKAQQEKQAKAKQPAEAPAK